MMKFKTHADAGSLYNTPNCYCIYMCGKVFKWLKKMGGLEVMKQRNEEKAKLLYDFLDQSKLFKGTVVPEDRSLMNVPFITGNGVVFADINIVGIRADRKIAAVRDIGKCFILRGGNFVCLSVFLCLCVCFLCPLACYDVIWCRKEKQEDEKNEQSL